MKIPFAKLIATAGLVFAAFGFAQDESAVNKGRDMGIGARGAFNYGMMYGFDETDDDVDGDPSGIGFDAGLMARVQLAGSMYFTPEVNFAYMSTDHKYGDDKRTYSSQTLEIPLLLRGVIMDRFYVSAGPQLNLCLSSKVESNSTYTDPISGEQVESGTQENFEQGSFSFGVAVGAGVNIVAGLNFDFRFYMGLNELYPDAEYIGNYGNMSEAGENISLINMAGAKMMTIKVGLSYWFI